MWACPQLAKGDIQSPASEAGFDPKLPSAASERNCLIQRYTASFDWASPFLDLARYELSKVLRCPAF
jgi:hypothetical protein